MKLDIEGKFCFIAPLAKRRHVFQIIDKCSNNRKWISHGTKGSISSIRRGVAYNCNGIISIGEIKIKVVSFSIILKIIQIMHVKSKRLVVVGHFSQCSLFLSLWGSCFLFFCSFCTSKFRGTLEFPLNSLVSGELISLWWGTGKCGTDQKWNLKHITTVRCAVE